jgi:hypothetical protein
MRKFICQSDGKHIMMSPIKTIMSVLKASTDIITNIPAREILAIMSVLTFKIAVILYLLRCSLTRNLFLDIWNAGVFILIIISTYNPDVSKGYALSIR